MKKYLQFLHGFIGIGALFGGVGAIMNPQGLLGVTTEMLKHSPFSSFMIPGLFLFFVIGMGNLVTLVAVKKQLLIWPLMSLGMGLLLMAWILVQCVMLRSVVVLHVIYFLLGALISAMAISPLKQLVEQYGPRKIKTTDPIERN